MPAQSARCIIGSTYIISYPVEGNTNETCRCFAAGHSGAVWPQGTVMMAAVQQAFVVTAPAAPAPVRPKSLNGTANDPRMDLDDKPHQFTLENGATFGSGLQRGDTRIVTIIYSPGQERILSVFAEVLGQPCRLGASFSNVTLADQGAVVGILASDAAVDLAGRDRNLVVAINAHCVNLGMPPDPFLSSQCDYEFLYTNTPFFRRDLARFISFTLGQINHHETLMTKPRTFMISTTFPDVRAALPNIDILTVGADAVELRVDLLEEPLAEGGHAAVPSLSYVGEQVMLLRQRTELPIIFTTRCTRENGRFPMDNPDLYYEYLYRAIQWGVEYIDVEVWLPERIRQRLWEKRGSSRIMSAFHDFSGTFKWPSSHAQDIFSESRRLADIVKMHAIINDHNENFELEYFRVKVKSEQPSAPPLSAVNMGEVGQFSRTLNRVFTPITHPLLPIIAAPGQMSAAQINAALAMVGQLPKKHFYGISGPSSRGATPQAPFYEKCFNELGLPHHFSVVQRQARGIGGVDTWCNQKDFGGAYLNPAMSHHDLISKSHFFQSLNSGSGPILTEAALLIGVVDTIVVRPGPASPASIPSTPIQRSSPALNGNGQGLYQPPASGLPAGTALVFDNALWRGVLSTLTRDLAPSAYFGCSAVVLASSSEDAASVIFALKALRVGKVFTVGFKTPPALATDLEIEPFTSLESLQRARSPSMNTAAGSTLNHKMDSGHQQQQLPPFVVVSALSAEKASIVGMVVRLFGSQAGKPSVPTTANGMNGTPAAPQRRVFLDLSQPSGQRRGADPTLIAEQNGFAAYGLADTAAFATVETLRLLVGQNVPYSFVRLASGRPY